MMSWRRASSAGSTRFSSFHLPPEHLKWRCGGYRPARALSPSAYMLFLPYNQVRTRLPTGGNPGFEPSVPRNRRPSRRQYRHIWAHGAWRGANSGVTHDLSRHSQPPGTVKRWIGGQFFEPVRSPDTLGATSRMKHSIDWRSWSRLRLPWKLI